MNIINKYLSGIMLPIAICFFAIFFIVKLRAQPLRNPLLIIKSVFKKQKCGGVKPIKAVIFALAGTLGVGNIVGVATAIYLGGAGSIFWMWISAFLAMILKYAEVVLAVKHRRIRNGENYGGAMYYMEDCFKNKKRNTFGYVFAFVFTIMCLLNCFSMGCMIQSNAISDAFKEVLNIPAVTIGIIVSILSIIVFFFNGKKIFSLCEKLVPFVSIIYCFMCIVIIVLSYKKVPAVFEQIIKEAFSFDTVGAGAMGFLISKSIRYGTVRGLFSNEAGCGTSPIAHATSNTNSPAEQGCLGIIEVFIDTMLICTLTALVILLNQDKVIMQGESSIMIAFSAFFATLGEFSNIVLCICVFLFAFATIVCWGYYGKECIYFINKSEKAEKIFYFIYVVFVFLGAVISMESVWQIADFAIAVMTVMNLITLALLSKEVKEETFSHNKRALK